MNGKSCKRPWRKVVKKLQRKRRRQKFARQREKKLAENNLEKLKDPLYIKWLEQQEEIVMQQERSEESERKEQEKLWLLREELAQKQFEKDRLKLIAEEAKLQAQRLKEHEKMKVLQEARQKILDKIKRETEKSCRDFDNILKSMQEYLEDRSMKTPPRLHFSVESRRGEKSCDFFDKTNCCRFGSGCTFNHKRPILTNVILIQHFFQHPLLKPQENDEYSRSDSDLELNERDLRCSYDEFCEDVWAVLEGFGRIKNFRAVRNVQAHLRGHVFVEYFEKRSALKAFTNLQNRYYASKRLHVEFSHIRQWRTAVCGMRSDFLKGLSLGRKCPKGVYCNFLHLMKNMDNKYNQPIYNPERFPHGVSNCDKSVSESANTSWNFDDNSKSKELQSRSWRWSESPEIELKTKNTEKQFENNTGLKKRSSCKSLQRMDSCQSLRSNSSDLEQNKMARTSSPQTPCDSHYKSNEKFFIPKKHKRFKSHTKDENKSTEQRESNSSNSRLQHKTYKRVNSSNSHYDKSTNETKSKSTVKGSKEL